MFNLSVSQDKEPSVINWQDYEGRTALHLAVAHGHSTVVQQLINFQVEWLSKFLGQSFGLGDKVGSKFWFWQLEQNFDFDNLYEVDFNIVPATWTEDLFRPFHNWRILVKDREMRLKWGRSKLNLVPVLASANL